MGRRERCGVLVVARLMGNASALLLLLEEETTCKVKVTVEVHVWRTRVSCAKCVLAPPWRGAFGQLARLLWSLAVACPP